MFILVTKFCHRNTSVMLSKAFWCELHTGYCLPYLVMTCLMSSIYHIFFLYGANYTCSMGLI